MANSTPGKATHKRAGPEDLDALTETLVSAFTDDPLFDWIFDIAESRKEQSEYWMRFSLEMGFTRGQVHAASENRTTAIWFPPGLTVFNPFWGGRLANLLKDLVGDRMPEVIGGLSRILGDHDEREAHYYLFTLGTHADQQGQGLGSHVMTPVLEECDAERIPARLESSNIKNLSFYRRHGFEVIDEISMGEEGPIIRPMYRPPRP
jgi:ribosomal protein S18 acetylase RimI-like enzyme